jgi:hypothetical protein
MPRAYHGSTLRYLLGKTGFHLRQILKRRRSPLTEQESDPDLKQPLADFNRSIRARDWQAMLHNAHEISAIAEHKQNAGLMIEMSKAFARAGGYGRAADLALAARQIKHGKDPKEWLGQDISDAVLLIEFIETWKQGLGGIVRYAPLLAPAIARARQSIIVTENRLVPILRRTFPQADVWPKENLTAAQAKADFFASYEHLGALFGKDAPEIERNFIPLRADPSLVIEFRTHYARQSQRPLVGLSWGSKSYNKDVPSLHEWSAFIRATLVQFVSLQYGKVSADLDELTGGDPTRVIVDTSVDQMKDMDRFAAQICALDAVISISNTAAHFSGALGVPAFFLIDDKFHTNWPVVGDKVPWYPRGHLLVKAGREWPIVLEDIRARFPRLAENGRYSH